MLMTITYAIAIAGLLGALGVVSERLCAEFGWPRRAPWALALAVSAAAPIVATFGPPSPAEPTMMSLPFDLMQLPEIVPAEIGAAMAGAVERPWPSLPRLSTLDGPLGLLWAASSAGMLLMLGAAAWSLRRALRGASRLMVDGREVRILDRIGPAVYGVVRPCVILPRRLLTADRALLDLVLRHEHEHIEARDQVLLVAALLLTALMPWNLALWWQLRRLRAAIEVDCDARVLRGGADPARYSEALLRVRQGSTRAPLGAVALIEPVSRLERRIMIMLHDARRLGISGIGARVVCALLLAGLAVAVNAPHAQQREDRQPAADNGRRVPAMREAVYVLLRDAQACAEQEDFECARERLDRVDAFPNQNDYERAQVWYFRAFLSFSEQDFPRTIAAYENVLRIPEQSLPRALRTNTLLSLAQLYAGSEQYTQSLEALDEWQTLVDTPSPIAILLRAQVQYQLGRFAQALDTVDRALSASAEPNEQWYRLKLAIQSELDDRQGMIGTLERMNELWPNDERSRQIEALQAGDH